MDIIEKARELGRLIQEEDSYKKLQDAQKNADADMELQRLIGEFNLKRMSINNNFFPVMPKQDLSFQAS